MPSRKLVIRTPAGQPDKGVSLLPVVSGGLGILVIACGALFSVMGDRTKNAIAESEKIVRAEYQQRDDALRQSLEQKIDNLRVYTDTKVTAMWQTMGQTYPTKAEWEARKDEIDRRLTEAHEGLDKILDEIRKGKK